MTQKHTWNFATVGGIKRVNLESGSDLMALDTLDQKLWTALSCPVNGLEIDARTLELIDRDKDGQIRVPEILAAVKWMTSLLKNADDLLRQEDGMPLSAINDATVEGKYLLQCAKIILTNLGKPNATHITVEDASDFTRIFAATPFNGDGIITEDSTQDEALQQIILEIKACIGSEQDRSGKPGVNAEQVDSFFAACFTYSDWKKQSENGALQIFPFGENTARNHGYFLEVKSKVEDYFLRCRLAAFDADSTPILNQIGARVETLANKDLQSCKDEIGGFPLAKIEAGKALPFYEGINPSWEQAMANFAQAVCAPGAKSLSEKEWQGIVQQFEPYSAWLVAKAGAEVENLGMERIEQLIQSTTKTQLHELIARDKELEDEAGSMMQVEQMVRYYRDLFTLLKNFVTFFDFYTPGTKAIFQAGTLYIDQRSCDLCIKVSDMGKHNSMVGLSGMFLIYCHCVSKSGDEQMTIVAALTNGDIDNLMVGRNAVFYDRSGKDWDATVIKIVDNPISIRQAFWTPYRKVYQFIQAQINKFASEQDEKVTSQATGAIEKKANETKEQIIIKQAPTEPATPFDIGKFVGIFAAISLALGAIGTAIASLIAGFVALSWWKMPLAIFGLMLLISGPSMIIAYFKLRKRNLAPLLDANGWAINAGARVNITFGNALTQIATLPLNSKINLNDPFTKKGIPLWKIGIISGVAIALLIYALVYLGYLVI
jgi:hypothetical protein